MKKRLELLHRFLGKILLINRQIIKFASLSLKYQFIDGQQLEKVNNPIQQRYSSEKLNIGAYEADYCVEFLKVVRKECLRKFFKGNGEFTITLLNENTFELHERIFDFVLEECDFKNYCTINKCCDVTYTLY